ncbi:hypothetical protein OHM08_002563 [Enterococcus faecium]|nr:hypothetical protein [Enterococcus faecium]
MAFSTNHYYVKPLVPRIKLGIELNGIRLSRFNARTALLLAEPFQSSNHFYYENDPKYAEKLNKYVRSLKLIKQEHIRDCLKNPSIEHKADIEAIETALDKLGTTTLSGVLGTKKQMLYGVSEDIPTPKELNIWIKKTYKQRKRKIQKLYSKKDYFEFHSFLNLCNDFLKSLGEQSLKLTNSLDLFFEIGSEIDWFLLNITECSYHQSLDFKNLFSSNVRVSNDLVSIVGALNILNRASAFELYLAQEQDFAKKISQYKCLFQELLISGNRIIDLETKRKKIKKDKELLSNETTNNRKREESLNEIQSMHDIAIDRKIQNIN